MTLQTASAEEPPRSSPLHDCDTSASSVTGSRWTMELVRRLHWPLSVSVESVRRAYWLLVAFGLGAAATRNVYEFVLSR